MIPRIARSPSLHRSAQWLMMIASVLLWSCGSASAQQSPLPDLSAATLALQSDGALPPSAILRQLDAMSDDLRIASPTIRDRARLIEIQALLDIGRIADAKQLAETMLAEPSRRADAVATVRAELAVLRVRLRQSDIKAVVPLAHAIMAQRVVFENDDIAPDVFAAVGSALTRAGEHAEAAQLMIDGLASADRFQRPDQKAYLLIGLCSLNYGMRNIDKALQYCQQGAQLAEKTGNKMARAAAAINLALCYSVRGDSKSQLAELEKSLALSREMGLKRAEAMAQINLADYSMSREDWKSGFQHCREGLRLGRELADPIMIAVSLTNLGTASAALGDIAGGVALYEQGLQEAERAGESAYVVDFLPGMADLYEKAGRNSDALRTMRRRVDEGEKLFQQSQADALAVLQSKYDADNRQREIRLLTLDNSLKSAALERGNLQARVGWLVGIVLVLVATLLVIAYRRLRRANRALSDENVELEHHSLRDPLTGLLNRRALDAILLPQETGARRRPTPSMAFVMIDVDHFKHVNDSHGHACGDMVLVELAHRLGRLVRPDDRLFRMGGEEFMLLLTDISDNDMTVLCRRMLQAVNCAPVVANDHQIRLTVSLGACRFPLGSTPSFSKDWQHHLRLADLALYQAKATGRNRALQITRIADTGEATLATIDSDFAAARSDGLVETIVIEG